MTKRVAVLALLLLVVPAWAVFPPPVKDDGKFFKPDALERANRKIKEIYEKYRKDVVVETLSSLTTDQEKAVKDDGKEKFFNKLAQDRVKTLGVNGIIVIVSKNPRYLRVDMDAGTRKGGFTNSERDKLFDRIASQFKEGDFDAGLLAGLEYVESALKGGDKKDGKKDK
ncbi:MAG: TPM domain-containing protein [Gemmataceae bacterium]|nr:TPM domain-containing protein [Gemmataceae bacterium]